jgi:hypothetical protein
MIVFDLECRSGGHRFEGWFGSSDDYTRQTERGLVTCPECGSGEVVKAVQAPNVGRKGNQGGGQAPAVRQEETQPMRSGPPLPPEAVRMMRKLARLQADAIKDSRWVGKDFAENARAMHYGERDHESIHGEATLEEAQELAEEGVEVAPLLFPVAPPGKSN